MLQKELSFLYKLPIVVFNLFEEAKADFLKEESQVLKVSLLKVLSILATHFLIMLSFLEIVKFSHQIDKTLIVGGWTPTV